MEQKQRKIGQQIMTVRMILREQEKGFSFLGIDTIANAMNVPEDEIREILDFLRALYHRKVVIDVVIELEKEFTERLIIYRTCIGSYVDLFYKCKLYNDEEFFSIYIKSLKECIVNFIGENGQIDDVIRIVEKGYILFGKKYVQIIEDMRSNDYDWAVIAEMFGKNIVWRRLFEENDAEDNFLLLKKIVEQES